MMFGDRTVIIPVCRVITINNISYFTDIENEFLNAANVEKSFTRSSYGSDCDFYRCFPVFHHLRRRGTHNDG